MGPTPNAHSERTSPSPVEPRPHAPHRDPAEDLRSRSHRTAHRTGDLAPAHALTVAHGNLAHAQARAVRLELHLDRPSETRVGHLQALERTDAQRAEGPEVRVARAEQDAHQE